MTADAALARAFTPTGKLRASINLGNPILANRHPTTGLPFGVSIDLAHEFAQRLGVDIELAVFDGAAKSVDAITQQQADIGFFAVDPLRAAGIHFTAPYVLIEGSYLVRQSSPLHTNAQVDAPGCRVAVGKGSAYDLFLTRTLKQAAVVREAGAEAALAAFHSQQIEVLAGIRQMLETEAAQDASLRLLPGNFMLIQQAMGCPRSFPALATQHLSQFVATMISNGFVGDALKRHGIQGASVAPIPPPASAGN